MTNFQEIANFVWTVADDILRGDFKNHEYGDVTLPFLVLRRLDCVMKPTKDTVIQQYAQFKDQLNEEQLEQVVLQATNGLNFYNASQFDLERLTQDASNIELNFSAYRDGFSQNVREILDNFQIDRIVAKLAKNNLLFMMCDRFTEVDLHPNMVSNELMGSVFEELLRRFNEMANETAGEHFTPREVIQLMVNLLFAEHKKELQGKGIIRTVYDPACGTGGMLMAAKEHIEKTINSDIDIIIHGQELNEQTYAICKSDVLLIGEDANNIKLGTSFSNDQFRGRRFNFMLSNPPFGVSWKKEKAFIENEANDPHGRFHAGTPRSSDGALLFLQHMISKMESDSRIAIVFNGSPLFTGDAGSGESNIRKWIIENDWLEAIVAMPTDMFFNTGIATYIWIVTNRKPNRRKGKVQLINTVSFYQKMTRGLGSKRNYISEDQIQEITNIYTSFEETEYSRIFENADFGYTKVTIERPISENGQPTLFGKSGTFKPDSKLRDYERVPLKDNVDEYFVREVKPHVPAAWMDRSKDKIGYEINFTRYFYEYQQLRSVEEIKQDILVLDQETEGLLMEVLGI